MNNVLPTKTNLTCKNRILSSNPPPPQYMIWGPSIPTEDCIAFTFFSMDFAVVVINELLNEGFVLFFYFISHVRDVAQHSFILHLQTGADTA